MRVKTYGLGLRFVAMAAGAVAAGLAALMLPAWTTGPELRLVSVATGARTGVYYLAGGAICRLVNGQRWTRGTRCITDESAGSIANLRALRNGSTPFAIVQSDWQASAYRGTQVFAGVGPDTDLRSVFSIYPEAFTVIAGPESGILRFADLLGKRVNIGPPGSGSRATADIVFEAMGWQEGDFAQLAEFGGDDAPRALCDGDIDAAVFIIAHPNLAVEEMITGCGADLVPVEAPGIAELVAAHSYYLDYAIPGGTYPGQSATVPGFALAATFVTTTATPLPVVYDVVRDVFAGLDDFRALHPAFAEFKLDQMLTDGLTAPLHAGARRFYREAGLWPPADPAPPSPDQ